MKKSFSFLFRIFKQVCVTMADENSDMVNFDLWFYGLF